MYASHIIFLEGSRSCTPEIMDMILTWATHPRCSKCLYHLIRDLLIFSLDIVVITSNIISFELGFIFNVGVSTNTSCFYIIKNIIYPM